MKILHVSDLHLGKILNQHNLIEDQKFMLNEIKNTLINNEIKALIIAGDIFDRSIPSAEAVTVLSNFLQDIDKIGVETFIISGNHDSKERLGFLSPLLEKLSLHIVTTITVPLKSYTIDRKSVV